MSPNLHADDNDNDKDDDDDNDNDDDDDDDDNNADNDNEDDNDLRQPSSPVTDDWPTILPLPHLSLVNHCLFTLKYHHHDNHDYYDEAS